MTLENIQIGKYTFTAAVIDVQGSVLTVEVACGADRLARKMNHMGTHDHSVEQFDKDVIIWANVLAKELAGTLRSRELADKYRNPSS